MGFAIEGDYFESCNCNITCRCIYGTKWDGDACDGFFGWHIARGRKEGIDLSGLSVVLARHRPTDLAKDRWQVELYIDEHATPERAKALETIFTGKAGGHLAIVFPKIGSVTGVHRARISFGKTGRSRKLLVEGVLEMQAEELLGMDGKNPCVIDNPTVWHPILQPLRQGRAQTIHYTGPWKFEASGTNSFISEFSYKG